MIFTKLPFVFSFLDGCPFDENRRVEKKLLESEVRFHNLYNQGKFTEIYMDADGELKGQFTENQFISLLQANKNETSVIEIKSHVWIDDDLKDGAKRILFKRIKFSNIELVYTDKAMYREKFEWNIRDDEAKIASYKLEKLFDKPCRLAIKTE